MKRRGIDRSLVDFERYRSLLVALSDDLSLPLMQIKTSLEIIENHEVPKELLDRHTRNMSLNAEAGLNLVEAYRLALKLHNEANLPMEPVAVGAVLQEVAHKLAPYANQYATDLEVDIQGKLTPVLAHRPSLVTAFQCLGASMIRAQASTSQKSHYTLLFGAHKSSDNLIAAGVFSEVQGLSDKALKNAHGLVGKAHQPLPNIPTGAASGVLIADLLCASMWRPLRAAAHRKMGGLATGVPASQQIQLI